MRKIEVYADWIGLGGPLMLGVLRAENLRGKEVFSFEYEKEWLTSRHLLSIDPDLNFFAGKQYVVDDKPNFGLFLDSSPDRWGRLLMQRREVLDARQAERAVQKLNESDYLLWYKVWTGTSEQAAKIVRLAH